ncbi:hypothetical protein C8J57DRAFT_1240505 [Mycena rebaudengoi]|nr:hypothetical protein C8J57DRAFT_1240505 [Mycena rebaudengoi]
MPRRSSCQRRAHAILKTLNGLIRAVGGFTQVVTNAQDQSNSEFRFWEFLLKRRNSIQTILNSILDFRLNLYLTNVKYSRSSEFWGQKVDMPRLAPIRKKWLGAGPSGARSILTNQNLMGCSSTARAVGVSPVCSLAATPEFEFEVAGDFFMAAWAAGCCTSTSLMGARIVGITATSLVSDCSATLPTRPSLETSGTRNHWNAKIGKPVDPSGSCTGNPLAHFTWLMTSVRTMIMINCGSRRSRASWTSDWLQAGSKFQ